MKMKNVKKRNTVGTTVKEERGEKERKEEKTKSSRMKIKERCMKE
jgi:hypothetical protein